MIGAMSIRLLPLFCVLLTASILEGADARRPSILFIISDDQRWDCVGAFGHPDVKTPAIDALAARGFSFSNTYCMGSMVGAVCTPSRTMVMTGRSLWRIPEPRGAWDGTPNLGKTFRDAGYATLFIGKKGNTYKAGNEAFETFIYHGEKDHAEAPQFYGDRTIEWLREHKSDPRPFCIYLGPPVPHDPRVAPKPFMEMYDLARLTMPRNFMPQHPFDNGEMRVRDEMLAPFPRTEAEMRRHLADYYACITNLDHHVGRVIDELKAGGQLEQTLIVYTSDHGLAVGGMHGLMGKQNLYEHNKAPLIIAGPGIPHGKSAALAYLFDLYPTLCEYSGLPVPERVEGRSLLPVMRGEKPAVRDTLFAAYRDCQRMVRDPRWKLIEYRAADGRHAQLFDLANDADEMKALSNDPAHAGDLARLREELARSRKAFADPVDWDAPPPPAAK